MTKLDCKVYLATKMTGCDKAELVARAERVCEIFKEYGLIPISPVFEEGIKSENVKLINSDKKDLAYRWQEDKKVIIEQSHVLFWDQAEQKSFGVEREYALNRFTLWKPTVIYVAPGTPTSVAEWEDDKVFNSVHAAAEYIRDTWGTVEQRRKWRWEMLKRTVPTFLYRQWLAFR